MGRKRYVFPDFHGDCSAEPYFDEDGVQVCSGLDDRGRELPDSVPMAPPIGYREGPSLTDMVKRTIATELSRRAQDLGYETMEEADDFDIEDDPLEPHTPYEAVFDPPPPLVEPPDPALVKALEEGVKNKQGEGGTPSKTSVEPPNAEEKPVNAAPKPAAT